MQSAEQEKLYNRIIARTGRDFANFSIINLASPLFHRAIIRAQHIYNSANLANWPEYIGKTAAIRANPRSKFPWLNSIIFITVPFSILPDKQPFIPKTDSALWSGYIAGYAGKIDYHFHGLKILEKLAVLLRDTLDSKPHCEYCIDTGPLAEKQLAAASGLGYLGNNTCLIANGFGSGCFICTLLTSANLPDYFPQPPVDNCRNCRQCLQSCPNNVLSDKPPFFHCNQCISHLTMFKTRILNSDEQLLLNNWLFGCDHCTKVCPESNLPPKITVDMRWILQVSTTELKNAISGTPLSYIGTTGIRKNALYLLSQRKHPEIRQVISDFATRTGSPTLQKLCHKILTEK